ncbi:MAG: MOSC domain-containing protein [Bacteroidota bacterium]
MSNMKALLRIIPQVGKVDLITMRPERNVMPTIAEEAEVSIEDGLAGDRYAGRNKNRQITLIQAEHLVAVASMLGKEKIDPLLTRRNLVVSGVNLLAFKDQEFQIGDEVVLKMTGLCHPCSKMETNLGVGGYNAMRGHGGITAKVVQGGKIRNGDAVKLK